MSISKIFSMRIFVLLAALIAAPLVPVWGVKVAYEQLFKEGVVAPLARAGDGKGLPERPLPQQYVLGTDSRDGGTLSGVARLFYGDGNKWPLIWEANKAAVPDPDRLKPGTILVIPALPEGN